METSNSLRAAIVRPAAAPAHQRKMQPARAVAGYPAHYYTPVVHNIAQGRGIASSLDFPPFGTGTVSD